LAATSAPSLGGGGGVVVGGATALIIRKSIFLPGKGTWNLILPGYTSLSRKAFSIAFFIQFLIKGIHFSPLFFTDMEMREGKGRGGT